jgi:hypothetical protein
MTRLRALFATFLLLLAAPLAAQAPDPAGLWALQADGRVVALIEVRRDSAAPGGWAGAWIRPDRLSITSSHAAYDIGGPVVRRPIRGATTRGDMLILIVQARTPEAEPDTFLFRLIDRDHAEFGWDDPRFPLMALIRADPGAAVASDWAPGEHPLNTPRPSNAEMSAIFEADQADRRPGAGAAIDWSVVGPRDRARQARTLELLNTGALRSGEDFFHAAFIFQHGHEPGDYLIAHTLAVIAGARGRPDAVWIAAATLDRYLQNIGQKQIYGTQFSTPREGATTQEPYDRALISDALRQALGVPPQADQERQRAEFEARARPAGPPPPR